MIKRLVKKDIKGKLDYKVDISNSVSFSRFFGKIKGKVYEFYKIANEDWDCREIPFMKEVPYVEFKPVTLEKRRR